MTSITKAMLEDTSESLGSVRMLPLLPGALPALLLVIILAIGLTGCGSNGPFDYVKVTGTVTYEDGSRIPTDQMVVTFVSQTPPIDGKFFPRSGIAYTDSEGKFSDVTSYKANDGLVPGKHKVIVIAGDTYSIGGSKNKESALVPKEYGDANTTPLEIDTVDLPLIIKVKKPA